MVTIRDIKTICTAPEGINLTLSISRCSPWNGMASG